MVSIPLESLVRLGGLLHLAIAVASLAVPGQLDWRRRLAVLDEFHRRLFWVYAGFVLYVNVGFGMLSLAAAPALVSGAGLGRLLAAFIALYWLLRLGVQLVAFDSRRVIDGPVARLGYHALTAAFVLLVAAYGLAALAPPLSP